MSEEAAAEFHLAGKTSAEFHQPPLFAVDPQRALHRLKDLSFPSRWTKVGVGRKEQFDRIALLLPEAKDQRLRQNFEDSLAVSRIVILLPQ